MYRLNFNSLGLDCIYFILKKNIYIHANGTKKYPAQYVACEMGIFFFF